jgi:hypothetical protein
MIYRVYAIINQSHVQLNRSLPRRVSRNTKWSVGGITTIQNLARISTIVLTD